MTLGKALSFCVQGRVSRDPKRSVISAPVAGAPLEGPGALLEFPVPARGSFQSPCNGCLFNLCGKVTESTQGSWPPPSKIGAAASGL